MEVDGWREYKTPEGYSYYHNKTTGETSWEKPACMRDASSTEQLVWIPHELHGYVAGRFVMANYDGSSHVATLDGEALNVACRQGDLAVVARAALDNNVSDLVQMDDVNEAMIVHNLRKRFANNEIYTNIGTILVSINPFKMLPLYTPTVMDAYMHKGNKDMPPHTYNIADDAYRAMVENKINQSILISGESGAGKTECTKQCLTYFAELAGSTSGVEQNILDANPILEAFGNAKTLRNNNSSRFGKWVEIHFDNKARICGAKTINYLLEKSRVVYQIEGERNFHIFYQLAMGASDAQRQKWRLDGPQSYAYLNRSGCVTVDGIDDVKDFEEVQSAMIHLGFTEEEMENVFEVIAAILHLGNVEFRAGTGKDWESSSIANRDVAGLVARLLRVDPALLERSICTRIMEIRGCAPTQIPLTPDRASDSRNALAKALYNRLFDWLVKRINRSMEPDQSHGRTSVIGVLDIFGFEIFDKNSFEQLCINFANEKLQQHFNQYTFKLEEKLYQSEGVNYEHITFIDNQPVLDLIEAKQPQGLMITMDEQLSVPKSSDQTFRIKANQIHGNGNHPNYVEAKKSYTDFMVLHYAGAVTYDVTGFLDKNKDTLQKDLIILVESSRHDFINTLFPPSDDEKKTAKRTVSGQFRKQLDNLMQALNQTEPHYIRCIKPNSDKAPDVFVGSMCLQQLRYAGVFEAVRIRQTGFPFRYSHENFLKRYGFLARDATKRAPSPAAACKALLAALQGSWSAVQVGKTRVLYRAPEHRRLELLRNVAIEKITVKIQACMRGMVSRGLYRRMRAVKPILESAIRSRNERQLNDALERSQDIEFPMKLIADARSLRDIVVRERVCMTRLNELLRIGDPESVFDELGAVIDEAVELQLDDPTVAKGLEAVTRIRNTRACRAELESATADSDRLGIESALARAAEIGFDQSEPVYQNAHNELRRIVQEEALVAALEASMATGMAVQLDEHTWDHSAIDVASVDSAIAECNAFGVKTKEGQRRVQEAAIVASLRRALSADDFDSVPAILKQANGIEFSNDETRSATAEVSHNTAVNDLLAQIVAMTEARDQEALTYALQQAESLQVGNRPEAVAGKQMLDAIVLARRMLKEAIEAVKQPLLERALAQAVSFGYVQGEVADAERLLQAVVAVQNDAAIGLYYMEREIMERALQGAEQINLETEDIAEIREALSLEAQKFIQKQLKTANQLGDKVRAIRLTIKLKEMFFEQFGKMFIFEEFSGLRTPDDFSKAKLVGREKLKAGMLKWTKSPIPTSLTQLDEVYRKQACRLFKNILGYMGDRSLPYPNALAQDLLDQALATPQLRNEVYCQLIKQLIDNPNPASVEKGWQLMKFCLQTFPPTEEFLNYLEMFLQRRSRSEWRCIDMLHDTQYLSPKVKAPSVEELAQHSDRYKPKIDMNAITQLDISVVPPPRTGMGSAGWASEEYIPPPVVEEEAALDAPAPLPRDEDTDYYGDAPFPLPRDEQQQEEEAPPPIARDEEEQSPAPLPRDEGDHYGGQQVGVQQQYGYQPEEASQEPARQAQEQPQFETLPPLLCTPDGIPIVKRVQAAYAYDGGGDPRRLAISEGDVIDVLQEYEGWGYGDLNGTRGLYPLNYVKDV